MELFGTLGIVSDGNPVGEIVYLSQKQQEFNKRAIRSIKSMFFQSEGNVFPRGTAQQGLYAKQVLRIAVAQTAIALSQAMDVMEPNSQLLNSQPLEKVNDNYVSFEFLLFGIVFTATCLIFMFTVCCMMGEPEPDSSGSQPSEDEEARRRRYMFTSLSEASDVEYWHSLHHHDGMSDSESDIEQHQVELDTRIPLRPSILKCYILLSASFTRLKQLLFRDLRQRGRGFALLSQLQQIFWAFEENRPNNDSCRLLHQMMSSISNMEEVARVQVADYLETETTTVLVDRMNADPELQPEQELPPEDDLVDAPMYEGPIPEAHEHMSPENIAGWMAKRLSRRIYSACVSGSNALKRHIAMRDLMRGTVLICQRSDRDRRRAMWMLHDIRDLSDHSSSDGSHQDPMDDYIDELPGDENMDLSESYQGEFYDFRERVYGPVDPVRDIPERASTIPAYVVYRGEVVYTIESDELPVEAERYAADGDWVYYTFLGHCYRVRNFPTREEVLEGMASSSNM